MIPLEAFVASITLAGPIQPEASLLLGSQEVKLVANRQVQDLVGDGGFGVHGPFNACARAALNHGLDTDLAKSLRVSDRALAGLIATIGNHVVQAWEDVGHAAVHSIVRRTAIDGKHGVTTEHGFGKDVVERDMRQSFFPHLALDLVDSVPQQRTSSFDETSVL